MLNLKYKRCLLITFKRKRIYFNSLDVPVKKNEILDEKPSGLQKMLKMHKLKRAPTKTWEVKIREAITHHGESSEKNTQK